MHCSCYKCSVTCYITIVKQIIQKIHTLAFALQEKSIERLARAPLEVCCANIELAEQALAIQDKHRSLLFAYHKCYEGYSAAKVYTDQDIAELGKSVNDQTKTFDRIQTPSMNTECACPQQVSVHLADR